MSTNVTAILVAQRGGTWLSETIAGIAAQTVAPAEIVAVNNGGGQSLADQLIASGASRVVGLPTKLSFGRAIDHAHDTLQPSSDEAEWLWFLSEDSCPEPEALERMLASVQRAPSVVVAGPKLVDWDDPERIIELGQSLTRYGSRWTLRRDELDQQQYDHMQDVLGVGPVGMLVRRDVWQQLGGFDAALPVYDDGLDFSVRARLAGHRVEVAPEARVRFARSGVAGPRIDRSRSVMRTAHRQARTAHLHRRIAYAPAIIAFFEWLALPIYGLLRVLWALIREQPGNMIGEFVSAYSVFFRPHLLIASRRNLRRNSSVGWAALRGLRTDPKTVRTARIIDREAVLAQTGRLRREIHFISSGGLGVVTAALAVGIALTWWALPHTSLVGGGLLPLSSFGELWWNTRIIDGVPADPFTWVLAVLGSVTFWNPSHIVVLLMVVAVPLAALGAWIWAAGLTSSKAGRALVALGYALSPVVLGALESGRLPSLILAIVLPWLVLAASRCRESWSWAGTASLLAGVALASAPVLAPAAIVMLVAGLCISVRGIARVLTTALVPLVLFAPKLVSSLIEGRPLDLLVDPGVVLPFTEGTLWHMLLSFPQFGLEGWGPILEQIGFGGAPATLLVGLMLAPIALAAIVGLTTSHVKTSVFLALMGGLGMLTALVSAQLRLAVTGSETVAIWTGSGLTVYWLAVLGLAGIGMQTLRRAAAPATAVALIGALLAVTPLAYKLVTGQVAFESGSTQMPAIVRAAGESNPGVKTLVIGAHGPTSVTAELVTGTGLRLDQIRSAPAPLEATESDLELASITAGLASEGGADMVEELQRVGVNFVLLTDGGHDGEHAQLQRVFDQNAALSTSNLTGQGLLWRVNQSEQTDALPGDASEQLDGTSISGHTLWLVQVIVLLGVLLLALPTGEVTWRPEKRRRQPRPAKAAKLKSTSTQAPTASAEAQPESAASQPPAAPELPSEQNDQQAGDRS